MSTEQTPLETLINNLELGKLVDHESNEFILALDFAINLVKNYETVVRYQLDNAKQSGINEGLRIATEMLGGR
jgi:hypothetical protein